MRKQNTKNFTIIPILKSDKGSIGYTKLNKGKKKERFGGWF